MGTELTRLQRRCRGSIKGTNMLIRESVVNASFKCMGINWLIYRYEMEGRGNKSGRAEMWVLIGNRASLPDTCGGKCLHVFMK